MFRIMGALFIFRRDLRVHDNTALIAATNKYDKVYCIFIATPQQLKQNKYKSNSAIQFMHESLQDLGIQLNFFYGAPEKELSKILKQNKIDEVFVNQDYTKYSIERDEKLQKVSQKNGAIFSSFEDHLLNPVDLIKTGTGKHYSIFTPYYNKAKTFKVKLPQTPKHQNFHKLKNSISLDKLTSFYKKNNKPLITGGRSEATKYLVSKNDYKTKRDTLTYQTTLLSAYIKFGCLSIREVYQKYKNNEPLVRQLYWHDFYTIVGYNNIDFTEKRIYQPKQNIEWMHPDKFTLWKEGKTGFPIVDATMRQLKHDQYCHNRGRLIASGFVKFMFMDWRIAEQHYAQNLRDYSPSINYHNWCWAMSFGPFSTPYFRIMNVFLQGKKHDPQAEYIKKWVPELKNIPAKDIHTWNIAYVKHNIDYPKPCVDYNEQRELSMNAYKKLFK